MKKIRNQVLHVLLASACTLAASSLPATGANTSAAKDDDLPLSKDALFADLPEAEKKSVGKPGAEDALPESKEALFADLPEKDVTEKAVTKEVLPETKDALFDTAPSPEKAMAPTLPAVEKAASPVNADPVPAKRVAASGKSAVKGYFQTELARAISSPDHWTKALGRLEFGSQGRLGSEVQWKASARIDYNAIYDLTNFYQDPVRGDQRAEFNLRETYLDFSAGGWDWRLGRQHIVWGEMVGLFFADVVSAKDLREFVLPDFQVMRIPQWAARTEYFDGDFHAELVWIPFPSYDKVGRPTDITRPGAGADFYPYPPSIGAPTILAEDKPNTSLRHGNFGIRATQLTKGWDMSAFYYTSMNSYPTWYRDPVVKTTFTPRHDRIWQVGGTLGKDLGSFVLKAEAVYTRGRRQNLVTDLADVDGVVKQNTLDWAVGLDFNPDTDTRVNTQLYQSYTFKHNADTIPDRAETGVSFLLSRGLPGNWRAEILLVHSLNRQDWMLRPKATWKFKPDWLLTFGADFFGGPPDGPFGQYDGNDRVYAELRYDF